MLQHLSFPSSESSNGQAGFNFCLSSTADTEGPQGSFECIQQTVSKAKEAASTSETSVNFCQTAKYNNPKDSHLHACRSLESLGALQCKMRIQANDDVYETTLHSTREIKPGGPGIGVKVKVKNPVLPLRRDRNPANSLGSSATQLKHNYPPKPSSNGYVSSSHHGILNGNFAPNLAHTKPQGNNNAQKPGNPDIMRRPLRERLIHLLAVRPYKKPELYDRINKDGLRERDKNNLTSILMQVAVMRDNTYQLIRHVWNDVQEDWPFYSEQEKQLLKRRKPQNLTPPGSSDGGSSGSGQSPTSTHPGSPPSTISSSSNMKRPGYIDGADGLPTKRKRISHYRNKPTEQAPVTSRLPDSSQQQHSAPADSSSRSDEFCRNKDRDKSRDIMNTNPRSRENGGSRASCGGSEALLRNNGYNSHNNSLVSSAVNGKWSSGPENEENYDRRSGISAQGGYDKSAVANKAHCESVASNSYGGSGVIGGTRVTSASVDDSSGFWNRPTENGVLSQSTSNRGHGGHHDNRSNRWTTQVSSTTQNSSASGSSPECQLENMDTGCEKEAKEKTSAGSSSEYPEYLLHYSSIRDSEQRRQYKADFTADYSEYRDLHAEVEKVSKRHFTFSHHREQVMHYFFYGDIKNQIVQEYLENKRDIKFQEAKRRFQYLHEKLSHIKRLVLEYDSAGASGGEHY
ncbi:hypothetical protein L798_05389 [Zootermopsis nevadensis]|uniref:OCEL domain-containing protein n=1 Tax=Zootermopsis nevadensis TaxID=136037 RepID=A0A067RHY7_ZOONE|nr:hypothetical protein L798_05389 [Zootermopsis nevadensis]